MIEDEDLLAAAEAPSARRGGRSMSAKGPGGIPVPPQKHAATLLAGMSGMSARERAAALRRAKSSLKRGISSKESAGSGAQPPPGSPSKRAKLEAGAGGEEGGEPAAGAAAGPSAEQEWQEILAGRWAGGGRACLPLGRV